MNNQHEPFPQGDAERTSMTGQQPEKENLETDSSPGGELAPDDGPELYIASLADYNNGKLHGVWLDATMDLEDIELGIRQMLERSPELQAEGEDYGDWAIHDYQGFGVATVHEHDDLDVLHKLAVGIRDHGEAFSAWAEVNEGDEERWPAFREAYLGSYDSLNAYGETIVADMGWQDEINRTLPAAVSRYARIDGEALVHDMWLNSEIQIIHKPGGGIWVFRGDI